MKESTSETPYDVIRQTTGVELSHVNIGLQSRYLWHRNGDEVQRKENIYFV